MIESALFFLPEQKKLCIAGFWQNIQPQVEFIQLKTIELFYSYNLWLNRPRVLLLQNNFHYAGHTFNPRLNKSMFSSYKQWQNDTWFNQWLNLTHVFLPKQKHVHRGILTKHSTTGWIRSTQNNSFVLFVQPMVESDTVFLALTN